MAYKQYTFCVTRADFDALDAKSFIGPALVALAGLIAALFTGPVGVIVAFIGAFWALAKVCHFLLGGKLICLGDEDACAIGRVVQIEPVGWGKDGFEKIDNDLAVNLLLAPHLPDATRDTIENDGLQGRLMKPQTETAGLSFVGYTTDVVPSVKIPVFHTEFEGSRIHDFCEAAPAAMAVLATAMAVGAAICFIPIIGWVACLVALALGAAIGGAIAAAILTDAWNGAQPGSATDAEVNPGDGALNAMNNETNEGGDYVIIRGRWCYDAGHDGWNELHPATSVQKIPRTWDEGSDAATITAFSSAFRTWCELAAQPDDPEVKQAQAEPRNDWRIHPLVDGCRPEEEQEPEPQPVPH